MARDVGNKVSINIKPTGNGDHWFLDITGWGSGRPGPHTNAILDDSALVELAQQVLASMRDRMSALTLNMAEATLGMLAQEVGRAKEA